MRPSARFETETRDPLIGDKNGDPNFRPIDFALECSSLSLTGFLSYSGLIALIHIHGNLLDESEFC